MSRNLPDPNERNPHVISKSKPRGGFIVHRRGSQRGDLLGRIRPCEHDSLESAMAEAMRLTNLHKREFSVFSQVFTVTPMATIEADKAEAA